MQLWDFNTPCPKFGTAYNRYASHRLFARQFSIIQNFITCPTTSLSAAFARLQLISPLIGTVHCDRIYGTLQHTLADEAGVDGISRGGGKRAWAHNPCSIFGVGGSSVGTLVTTHGPHPHRHNLDNILITERVDEPAFSPDNHTVQATASIRVQSRSLAPLHGAEAHASDSIGKP